VVVKNAGTSWKRCEPLIFCGSFEEKDKQAYTWYIAHHEARMEMTGISRTESGRSLVIISCLWRTVRCKAGSSVLEDVWGKSETW